LITQTEKDAARASLFEVVSCALTIQMFILFLTVCIAGWLSRRYSALQGIRLRQGGTKRGNVYFLRAKPQPSVSTPVTSQEVELTAKQGAAPLKFTSDAALKGVKQQGDLFEPLLTLKRRLPGLRPIA
jgi:hypothetical protein